MSEETLVSVGMVLAVLIQCWIIQRQDKRIAELEQQKESK